MVSSAKRFREVINVDKEEERAENTSLAWWTPEVTLIGGRHIALQEDLLCAVS